MSKQDVYNICYVRVYIYRCLIRIWSTCRTWQVVTRYLTWRHNFFWRLYFIFILHLSALQNEYRCTFMHIDEHDIICACWCILTKIFPCILQSKHKRKIRDMTCLGALGLPARRSTHANMCQPGGPRKLSLFTNCMLKLLACLEQNHIYTSS